MLIADYNDMNHVQKGLMQKEFMVPPDCFANSFSLVD